jgi:alkanesulfonate monooxygenase
LAVEFIATLDAAGLAGDPDYPAAAAGRHEEAGFDRLLIDDCPGGPDAMSVAGQVLTATARLGVLVTCRPDLVSPGVAARQYATLAAFHPGRVALYLTAADDRDQVRCAQEFLDIVRLTWSSAEPFRYAGACYLVADAWSAVRPGDGRLPVYLAGDSGAALRLGGRHADVGIVSGGAGLRARLAELRAAGRRHGRAPRPGIRVRPAGRAPAAGELAELISLGARTLLLGAVGLRERGGHGSSVAAALPAELSELADCARLIERVRDLAGEDGCQVA